MDSLHRFSIERLTSNTTADSQVVPQSKVDDWQNTTMFLKDYWQNYSSNLQQPSPTSQQLQHSSSFQQPSRTSEREQHNSQIYGNINVHSNTQSNLVPNETTLSGSSVLQNSIASTSIHKPTTSNTLQHNQIYPTFAIDSNTTIKRDSLTSSMLSNTQKQSTSLNALSHQNEDNTDAVISQDSSSFSKDYDTLHSSAFTTPGISSNINYSNQQSTADGVKETQRHRVLSCHKEENISGQLESVSDVDSNHDDSCGAKDNEDNDEKEKSPQKSTDPNEKPQHSYIALISEAILSYPEKKLVLSDIYQFIMDNYPYYNNQERAWRNSIRHNLSLNECFIKAGRAENGKGNYWAIHPACIEDFSKGDYRRRHARRRARGGPYADINVSALPYNYRCNLGYVPMTPTLGYPYHLPYLHSLSQQSTSNLFSRMASNDITANQIAHSSHKKRDNMYLFKDSTRPDYKTPSSIHAPGGSGYQPHKNSLLPHTYLPNVLSQSLRYSPYGFPFF